MSTWCHLASCDCKVCTTLRRLIRHIAVYWDISGYLDFVSVSLRAVVGEISD